VRGDIDDIDPDINLDLQIFGLDEESEENPGSYVRQYQTRSLKVNFYCDPSNFVSTSTLQGNEKVTLEILSGSDKIKIIPIGDSGNLVDLDANNLTQTWDISTTATTTISQDYAIQGLTPSESLRDVTIRLSHNISSSQEQLGVSTPRNEDTVNCTVIKDSIYVDDDNDINPDPKTNLDLQIVGIGEDDEETSGGFVGQGQTHSNTNDQSILYIKANFYCNPFSVASTSTLQGGEQVTLAILSGSEKIKLTPINSDGSWKENLPKLDADNSTGIVP